jgi:hypothetical protein
MCRLRRKTRGMEMTKAQEMLERQLTEWFNALPGESIGKNNYDKMIGIVRLAAQADAPTIDNTPSCGQENDYRRALPQSPTVPVSVDEIVALLRDELSNMSSFDARVIGRIVTERYSVSRPVQTKGE